MMAGLFDAQDANSMEEMMTSGSRRFYGLIGTAAILMMIGSAVARDYVLEKHEGSIQFELRTDAVAIGFSKALNLNDRVQMLSNITEVSAESIEREAPALGMTMVRLRAGSGETEVEAVLSTLMTLPEVDWVSPVLLLEGLEHVAGPYLYVAFEPGSITTEQDLIRKYELEPVERCDWAEGIIHVRRPKSSGIRVLELCSQMSREPGVLFAEPDFNRVMRQLTNDPDYSTQWHLNNTGQWPAFGTPGADIDAPEAWTYETGDPAIVISICDVGVEIGHPDLNDDIETGYDAVDGDSDPNPETTNDGHGTCCAGLAAAETNNSLGVAGVGYDCHLLGTKMGYIISGNQIQSNDTWIINCFNYSRDNADIMSNSWGGGSGSGSVTSAINNVKAAGLTVFFSSGNGNGSISWPASLSSVITVGATNEDDDRCDPADWGGGQGSNYGSQLDICAPGNSIVTTDLTGNWGYANGDYYDYFGGTSAACPIAAGVAGLILSVDASLTPDQVEAVLEATADDQVGDPGEDTPGYDIYHGWGRVNADNAVRYVFGPPSSLTATDNQSSVPLAWTASWRTPFRYDIYRSTTGEFGTYSVIGNTTSTSYDDNNVSHLVTYWYKIKAVYFAGVSEFSNADSGTPYFSFDPPQNLVAIGGIDGVIPVSWALPATGSPDEYELYGSTSGEFGVYSLIATMDSLSYNDFAVVNGNEYWYKAKALYSGPAGVSDFSNADNATPQAPANLTPVLYHDPLHDLSPGTGTITAISTDPDALLSIVSVRMIYRVVGAGVFDSLDLAVTGNPNEYSADLSGFAADSYEYYLRSEDSGGADTLSPAAAPTELHQFDVGEFCGSVLAYDDGSAETYNYATGGFAEDMRWAVKFTPAEFPYILCGASFAAARTIPDTAHSPVEVAVMLADGGGGLPGTTVWQENSGSVGNVVGGLPAGTNFANVLIRDAGNALMLNGDFYIVVDNVAPAKSEAFGRDTDIPNQSVSYFWDACDALWYSEDDTGLSDNAYPGNRMIRAYGYALTPPVIVVARDGDDIRLHWDGTGAASYGVYSALDSDGPFSTLEGTTADTTYLDVNAFVVDELKFYQVVSVSH